MRRGILFAQTVAWQPDVIRLQQGDEVKAVCVCVYLEECVCIGALCLSVYVPGHKTDIKGNNLKFVHLCPQII